MQKFRTAYRTVDETPHAAPRLCEHPGCVEAGEFRAPKGRDRLNEYFWFCLEHVRAYNKAWDYYAGMSQDQIEEHIRNSTTWERPTWRMGEWRNRDRYLRDRVMGDHAFGAEWSGEERAEQPPPRHRARTAEEEALSVLGLEPPVDFDRIKARYRELAKQHHPDMNGGSKQAEETLKTINQAYNTLKAAHAG